jgi:perosamine synthetase
MQIPYSKPSITNLEVDYVARAACESWGAKAGSYVRDFENDFAKYLGVKYAVATSSCTGASHLALAALGIGPGDEVIIADTNWLAVIAPIYYVGAKPVVLDIDEITWCLNTSLIENRISERTKAIIITHLYGNVGNLNDLIKISKKYDIYLIEDAAEAIGSEYNNKKVGTFGDFGVFSFHGSKTLTTGEGGMIVSDNEELITKIRMLNNHGRTPQSYADFRSIALGYKYKMTDLQAALGIAQLSRVDELVVRKQQILDYYKSALLPNERMTMNPVQKNVKNGAWMPNLVFTQGSGINREKIMPHFRSRGIDARPFFWPLSSFQHFKLKIQDNPISHSVASRSVNLPSFHDITNEQLDYVVSCINSLLDEASFS